MLPITAFAVASKASFTGCLMVSTVECTAAAVLAGTWKKYNINPAANRKWAPSIPIIRKREYLEFLNAGVRTAIKTEPDNSAAVITKSHCSMESCKK